MALATPGLGTISVCAILNIPQFVAIRLTYISVFTMILPVPSNLGARFDDASEAAILKLVGHPN